MTPHTSHKLCISVPLGALLMKYWLVTGWTVTQSSCFHVLLHVGFQSRSPWRYTSLSGDSLPITSHEFCASFAFLPSYGLCISKASQQKANLLPNLFHGSEHNCILMIPLYPTKSSLTYKIQTATPIWLKLKRLVAAEMWLILDAIRGNPAKEKMLVANAK